MNLFGPFRRRPPPAPPALPPPPPAPLTLTAAPTYVPLPVNGSALDTEVSRRWLAFQQSTRTPTWDAFIQLLTAEIDALDAKIARHRDDLTNYPLEFVP